jgi:hypothetical protein
MYTDLILEGAPVVGAAAVLAQGIAEAHLAVGARWSTRCGSCWVVGGYYIWDGERNGHGVMIVVDGREKSGLLARLGSPMDLSHMQYQKNMSRLLPPLHQ